MGYTTDFEGQFDLDKVLTDAHRDYLLKFAETRRMKRNIAECEQFEDPVRIAAGLPVGVDGEFFVGAKGDFGQGNDSSIVDYNRQPSTQPGLWCQWVPSADGDALEWDGNEKFYAYVEWLQYIINKFLKPWGYTLNGMVQWSGEEVGDIGQIHVKDNQITTKTGTVVFE